MKKFITLIVFVLTQVLSVNANNNFKSTPAANSYWFNSLIGEVLSKGDAQTALFALGMWNPQNKVDSNYYKYYRWLTTIDLGIPLQAQDTVDIYSLAQACPFTDGKVVFAARTLFSKLTHQFFNYPNTCNNNYQMRITKKNTIKQITSKIEEVMVYPNPTKGTVNIKLPENGKWQISATDMEGRIIWQEECRGCEGTIKHRLEGSKGLYLIKITNTKTGQQSINKITLQ